MSVRARPGIPENRALSGALADHRAPNQAGLAHVWIRYSVLVLRYLGSSGTLAVVSGTQFLSVVLLARHLGIDQFGRLMAVSAVTTVASTVCGLGAFEPLVRRTVRDPTQFEAVLNHALTLVFSSGILLAGLAAPIALWMITDHPSTSVGISALLAFCLGNILLTQIVSVVERAYIARQDFLAANLVLCGSAVTRLVVTLAATLLVGTGLGSWMWWNFGVHLVCAVVCLLIVMRGRHFRLTILRDEIALGLHQMTPLVFDTLRQNTDRLVLSIAATSSILAAYSVAVRIVQTSTICVFGFNRIIYPSLVARAQVGGKAWRRTLARLLVASLGISSAMALAMCLLAPTALGIFGHEFLFVVDRLKVLTSVIVLGSAMQLAYDALGAMEQHAIRAHVYNCLSVAGAALVAMLVFQFGLDGAVYGSIGVLVVITAAMWILVLKHSSLG